MDIEGAEFALLRHLLAQHVADRIKLLPVEWHERFVAGESAASRDELETRLRGCGVQVVRWG